MGWLQLILGPNLRQLHITLGCIITKGRRLGVAGLVVSSPGPAVLTDGPLQSDARRLKHVLYIVAPAPTYLVVLG